MPAVLFLYTIKKSFSLFLGGTVSDPSKRAALKHKVINSLKKSLKETSVILLSFLNKCYRKDMSNNKINTNTIILKHINKEL